jgi:hypothetical protein
LSKAIRFNDRAVAEMGHRYRGDARGLLVSEDGNAVYRGYETILCVTLYGQQPVRPQIELKTPSRFHFMLRSNSKDHLVYVAEVVGPGGRVTRPAIEWSGKSTRELASDLTAMGGPSQPFPIPDAASNSTLYSTDYREGPDFATWTVRSFPDGLKPFKLDFRLNVVAWHSRHNWVLVGKPGREDWLEELELLHDRGTKTKLPTPAGAQVSGVAMTEAGTVYVSMPNSTPRPGLFRTSAPWQKLQYLGPYFLEGSSASGKWLLLSHVTKRECFLVRG